MTLRSKLIKSSFHLSFFLESLLRKSVSFEFKFFNGIFPTNKKLGLFKFYVFKIQFVDSMGGWVGQNYTIFSKSSSKWWNGFQ